MCVLLYFALIICFINAKHGGGGGDSGGGGGGNSGTHTHTHKHHHKHKSDINSKYANVTLSPYLNNTNLTNHVVLTAHE